MKKRNEDNHNSLGEPDDQLPAETLKMINELLERLHKAGHINQGSKIEIVYVASGGQHVDTQINVGAHPNPPKGRVNRKDEGMEKGARVLPEPLATEKAMVLWEEAQEAGLVDEDYLPLLSRTQSALLADAMAERLGIKEKWKVFEELWQRKYMRNDYNLALTQRQSYKFQDDLKQLFG